MSNWSSVIITWSGVDSEACGDAEDTEEERRRIKHRLAEIDRLYAELYKPLAPFLIMYPCHDGLGMAVELVALCNVNHFIADHLVTAIRSLRWELPEEVQIMWKTENDERYNVCSPFLEAEASPLDDIKPDRRYLN